MGLVDTHAHLYFPDYDTDREAAFDRAFAGGVEAVINVGTDLESSRRCLELANSHPALYASAGVHPNDSKEIPEDVFSGIRELLKEPRVVAVGEVGLDFYREFSPHDVQEKVFRRFIGMHRETGKPLIIHCRDAYDALVRVLRSESGEPYRGVIHCYSSDRETMLPLLELGFHISFAGPLTYKKNEELREACQACPEDRLLFETDAPFLSPASWRGKRNESSYMVETVRLAAQIRGVSFETLAEKTTANARCLFGLQ
jgi:TatD DNase family protein